MPEETPLTRQTIVALFSLPTFTKYGRPETLEDVTCWLHYGERHEELIPQQFEAWWEGFTLRATFEDVRESPDHLELRYKKQAVWVVALPPKHGRRFTFEQTFSVGPPVLGWEPV